VADPVRLEQLDDPGDLVDRPGFAGVDGQPEAELARSSKEALVVGDPERGGLGARDIDPHHAPVAPQDGFLDEDLIELVGERPVEAEQQPGLDRVLEGRPVHPAQGGGDDVVEVLLAAPVALHRVEPELGRGDVVLAVRAADDLVHGPFDGQRAGLDELGPVEQLEIAVEAVRPSRRDGDQVAELPIVLGREPDPLGMGDAPHDRRGDRAAEVAMEVGEGDLPGEQGHPGEDTARPAEGWADTTAPMSSRPTAR
jgi:hypothetical protein